jgi:hypothetical protein
MFYISVTVQDILDTEFYYAYLISKPINKNSEVHVLKYGITDDTNEEIDLDHYHGIMD